MAENYENTTPENVSRRTFLAVLSSILGAIGVGVAAIPFIKAMNPTKDILAAGKMEVDISGIKEGELKTVIWRRQPVFILRRTQEMINSTAGVDPSTLADPAGPQDRTVRPDLFVSIGICTHLGCIPKFIPGKVPDTDMPGFYCPCHGGKYDSLGRRLGGPPPENLHLVPYRVENDNRLVIGTEAFAGYGENKRKIGELPQST